MVSALPSAYGKAIFEPGSYIQGKRVGWQEVKKQHSLKYIHQLIDWGFSMEFIARDCGITVESLEMRLYRERRRNGIKETSLKLAAVSLISDEAKRVKNQLRADLKVEMDGIGADRVKAELDGETIAFVSTSKPKFKWIVTNERKFVEWVMDNCVDELVTSVRESSREAILDRFNYVDELVIDPNGEVVEWLIGDTAEPYLVTKFQGEGRDKLREAIVGRAIEAAKVLELE